MAEKDFTLRIISPERVFYEGKVDMVEFNTTEGEIGVLPGHIPMTVILKPGVLTIHESEGNKEAALHTGFAEILPSGVSILAEVVEWPEEIDKERAEDALHRAQDRLANASAANLDVKRAETALLRAMARIETIK